MADFIDNLTNSTNSTNVEKIKKKDKKIKKEKKKIETIDREDFLNKILADEQVDELTKNFMSKIKNPVFMENVYDQEKKLVVNSIFSNGKTKLGRDISRKEWEYYTHRGKKNVNRLIAEKKRENLTINYKIFQPNHSGKKIDESDEQKEEQEE